MQIEVTWGLIGSVLIILGGFIVWALRKWVVERIDQHDTDIAALKEEKAILKATQEALLRELVGLRKEMHALNQNIVQMALSGRSPDGKRHAQG